MNTKLLVQVIGGFVLILGIAGLIMGEGQIAGMINKDMMLDLARILLGGILIGSTFLKDEKYIRWSLILFGVVYLMNFGAALVSSDMFGLLPSGLAMGDNLLHLLGGIVALGLAFMPKTMLGGNTTTARA